MPPASPKPTSWSLAPDVGASADARRALEGFSGQLDDDLMERSTLVITEVVTNSVTHADLEATQPIDLRIVVLADMLRVEVVDQGEGFEPPTARPDPSKRSGGWGLLLVDQLTDRWGVDISHSTRVWCEFDRTAAETSRAVRL